ncbi:MAG TPA: ABC transporter permease [Mesotoga sp.]|jgi:simple sugar transport system permease protein|uniref:ABC transporter permease n=1 Tax=unclassified Mesotoga TaxID=1184398 RepID=UPI000B11E362|nr:MULTISPECIES: ABC transporter permease [unclassified Mesotoga]MDD3460896.1 ABC transporter permease [Mesotoga sp.]PXF34874.1 ABC transporter permease [Mesotoga sp. SC_NapDC]RAM60803.1 ABC transporter permease [Mesotoga sp. SC_3PWM13N19]HNU23135.1 ABC transporter permease [Mesotoga sp.]
MNNIESFILSTLSATVRAGTPLLFAVLGTIFTERSGVMNLGLEGLMLVGAIGGFVASYQTSNLLLAILVAMLAGAVLGLVHAFFTVTLRVNQIVSGLAITMLGTGLSGLWGRDYIGVIAKRFQPIRIPVLSDIPYLGQILFSHDLLVYISFLLVPVMWFFIYKTRPGLTLRAVGESPEAADAKGINVFAVRYIYTILGGSITAIGGAYLSLAYNSMWIENMTAGRGWIAIALVLFATWDPVKALIGAYLFGGITALGLRLQAVGAHVSPDFLKMLPYLLTIVVLFFTSTDTLKRKVGAPASLGVPYSREERT